MRHALLFTIAFLQITPAFAQEKKGTNPSDARVEKYLAAEADKLSEKSLDGASTVLEWKQKRPRLYQEYMDMLGLWPLPEKTALLATKTGEVEAHGVVVEKIHFQSKPGLYVTANLYRAPNDQSKRPAIVYVCGHSFKGRDGNKSAYQDHGFWFANNGYICIILDSLQLGEIPGVHHGTYGQPWRHASAYGFKGKDKLENRFWWHALGYSPAAVECWNGMRAIDYLCTRSDVDPDKIGVTGISGGGAATFWIAAADERIKVAVPVSGMSDLESYVKNKVINGHCDCMFLYNTYRWDWTTIAALVAPRPLLFANSDMDPIFPMDGNRRVIAKLKTIYTMYGKPDHVDDYVSPGGHAYRPDLRVAIFKFINKHLKADVNTPVEDSARYTPLEGHRLRVFPEESDLPTNALNERIDEVFIPPAKVKLPEKGNFAAWKTTLLKRLREKSFASFPDRIPAATMPEETKNWQAWELNTESSIVTHSVLMQQPGKEIPKTATLLLWDEKGLATKSKKWPFDEQWAVPYVPGSDKAVFIAPRGVLSPWDNKSPPNYVKRAHVLLGLTVDQGRVRDICAEAAWLTQHDKIESFRVVGRGEAGILGAYAALFEHSIKEVVVIDPPSSHKNGPYFLNVLRVLDIPEALGLLAPTPLTIIGSNDSVFERTAEIYRLAGAGDKLQRK